MDHGWQRRNPTRETGIGVTLPSLSTCGGGFLCRMTRPGGEVTGGYGDVEGQGG